MTILALLLSIIVPPLGIAIGGISKHVWIDLVIAILAIAVFWFFAAGVGVILWFLAICYALAIFISRVFFQGRVAK